MFKWLARYVRTSAETAGMSDPWSGSGDFYVSLFKVNLDQIARELSGEKGKPVRTRFNQKLGCAELFVPFSEVVARVKVQGEMCNPQTAIITLLTIPETTKPLFVKGLPLDVEFAAA